MDIVWHKRAIKQLIKLKNPKAQAEIRQSIKEELVDYKASRKVKYLVNYSYDYRLRVGNYRVFFNANDVTQILSIEEVKKRDERTY